MAIWPTNSGANTVQTTICVLYKLDTSNLLILTNYPLTSPPFSGIIIKLSREPSSKDSAAGP
mgnify:CR=1 FL=1